MAKPLDKFDALCYNAIKKETKVKQGRREMGRQEMDYKVSVDAEKEAECEARLAKVNGDIAKMEAALPGKEGKDKAAAKRYIGTLKQERETILAEWPAYRVSWKGVVGELLEDIAKSEAEFEKDKTEFVGKLTHGVGYAVEWLAGPLAGSEAVVELLADVKSILAAEGKTRAEVLAEVGKWAEKEKRRTFEESLYHSTSAFANAVELAQHEAKVRFLRDGNWGVLRKLEWFVAEGERNGWAE